MHNRARVYFLKVLGIALDALQLLMMDMMLMCFGASMVMV